MDNSAFFLIAIIAGMAVSIFHLYRLVVSLQKRLDAVMELMDVHTRLTKTLASAFLTMR